MYVNLNYKGMFLMKIFKLIIVVLLVILTLYSGYLAWDYKATIVICIFAICLSVTILVIVDGGM